MRRPEGAPDHDAVNFFFSFEICFCERGSLGVRLGALGMSWDFLLAYRVLIFFFSNTGFGMWCV